MNRSTILILIAFFHQEYAQVVSDNFDPRIPRPGATHTTSIDSYGMSRPLQQTIDSLGISYRPSPAGAVLPALYDSLGSNKLGGLNYAFDPIGYSKTSPGTYGAFGGYDSYLARPTGFVTSVGGNTIFPDPNPAVLAARVPGPPLLPSTVTMPVMPVPVTPLAPMTYSVNPLPVNPLNIPISSVFNPMPTNAINTLPVGTNLPLNAGVLASAFPSSSNLGFGGPIFSGGLAQSLPFGSTNLPVNSGSLQAGSGGSPLNSGIGISGSASGSVGSNGNFLAPI